MTTSEGQPKLHLDKSEIEQVDVTIPDDAASVDKTEVQFVENILPAGNRDYGDTAVRHTSERSGISGTMKDNEAKAWYKRKTVIAAGAISAAGAVIVGHQFVTAADQINQITSSLDNESRLTSVPVVGEDFFETNTIQIPAAEKIPTAENSVESNIDKLYSQLESEKERAISDMQEFMSPSEKALVNRNFPSDKSAYSNADVLADHSIGLWAVSNVDGQSGASAEEEALYELIIDKGHSSFNVGISRIQQGVTLDIFETTGSLPNPEGKFANVELGDDEARLIPLRDVYDGKEATGLFRLYETNSGNQSWRLMESYGDTTTGYNEALAALIEKEARQN